MIIFQHVDQIKKEIKNKKNNPKHYLNFSESWSVNKIAKPFTFFYLTKNKYICMTPTWGLGSASVPIDFSNQGASLRLQIINITGEISVSSVSRARYYLVLFGGELNVPSSVRAKTQEEWNDMLWTFRSVFLNCRVSRNPLKYVAKYYHRIHIPGVTAQLSNSCHTEIVCYIKIWTVVS